MAVHEAVPGAVRLGAGDASVAVFAVDDPAATVEGIAVGVIGGSGPDDAAARLRPAHATVRPHVAVHDRLLVGEPHRSLGPDATPGEARQPGGRGGEVSGRRGADG